MRLAVCRGRPMDLSARPPARPRVAISRGTDAAHDAVAHSICSESSGVLWTMLAVAVLLLSLSVPADRFAVIDSFDVCGPILFPGPHANPNTSVVSNATVDSAFLQSSFSITPSDRTETIGFLCTIEGCDNHKVSLPLPFGLFPTITGSGPPWCADPKDCHNGGVVQRANLSAVLERFTEILPNFVPDLLYDGYVQLDFEDWTPIWEENSDPVPFHGRRYQEYSIQLVNQSHPHLNASAAQMLAKQEYEKAALAWFVGVLDHLHRLRPRAHFAWYGVPDTTSYWANYDDPTQGAALRARNDRLIPLWAASGWIAPSVCVLALRTASVVPASWIAWLDCCLTCSAHVVQTDTWPMAFLRRSSGSTSMLVCERRCGALVRARSSMHAGEVARRWR